MSQSSVIQASQCAFLSPRGIQEGRVPAIWQPLGCTHSLRWALKNSGCEKHILAPDSWEAYERSDFTDPRLLHLPIYRKALNSLTWDIWFSLISTNLLLFKLLGICCKLLYYMTPPHPSWEHFSQGYLRHCLPGLKSKKFPLNKT